MPARRSFREALSQTRARSQRKREVVPGHDRPLATLRDRLVPVVAAVGVFGLGLAGGAVLDDDNSPVPPRDAVNRYMGRVSAEWATMEQLVEVARQSGADDYKCGTEARRLAPVHRELEAIRPPDDALQRHALLYLARLRELVRRCEPGSLSGIKVAKLIEEAQAAWNPVRVRALELGWDTPCALQNRIGACLGR